MKNYKTKDNYLSQMIKQKTEGRNAAWFYYTDPGGYIRVLSKTICGEKIIAGREKRGEPIDEKITCQVVSKDGETETFIEYKWDGEMLRKI